MKENSYLQMLISPFSTEFDVTQEQVIYCTISINSSGTVTRDTPDENMVSATSQFCRDMYKIFGSLAPQATKNFYIRHMITK